MNVRGASGRGALAAAACVACCAPLLILAVGLTAGLAATAAIFIGLFVAVTIVLLGGAAIATASVRRKQRRLATEAAGSESVPVPFPSIRPRN